MNVVEGFGILIGTIIIFAVLAVFGVAKSDIVTARADKERALIAGEVYAQTIENESAQDTANWWQEIRTAVKPVAVFSFRAIFVVAAIVLIGLSIVTALGGGRWLTNKAAAPIVTQAGNGVAIVTHNGATIAIDLHTFQRGKLLEATQPSEQRAKISLAVEMAKVASKQPVVMGALPSANGGEYDG